MRADCREVEMNANKANIMIVQKCKPKATANVKFSAKKLKQVDKFYYLGYSNTNGKRYSTETRKGTALAKPTFADRKQLLSEGKNLSKH